MKSYSIRPNKVAEEVLADLQENYGCSKVDSVNILAEKYLLSLEKIDSLTEELSELKRWSFGSLRAIEEKVNVLYEVENTRQENEKFPDYIPTTLKKNRIIKDAEDHVESQRALRVFQSYEKRVVD